MPCDGQLVEVRRLAGHDAPVIGADVEPADVVAHDDDDVGLLGGRLSLQGSGVNQRRNRHDRRRANQLRTAQPFLHRITGSGKYWNAAHLAPPSLRCIPTVDPILLKLGPAANKIKSYPPVDQSASCLEVRFWDLADVDGGAEHVRSSGEPDMAIPSSPGSCSRPPHSVEDRAPVRQAGKQSGQPLPKS